MRLLTFSFLKCCKLKPIYYKVTRTCTNDKVQSKIKVDKLAGDLSLIEFLPTWKPDEEVQLRADVVRDMQVLPDFISEEEEASLMAELEPYLKRMRYEFDHWDNAIQGFRETERSEWSEANAQVLARVRRRGFGAAAAGRPLCRAHVLDLAAAGHVKPHVDALRFCGEVIAGISLCSAAVMRLRHSAHTHLGLDALLPARSLYIMRGVARYSFTHEVLGGGDSVWRGQALPRRRRVAIITRSEPKPSHQQ